MRELLSLAATLIEASGATERRETASRAVLVVIATTVAALCGFGAVICLLAALWIYEEPLLSEVGAPLVVAAVLAAAALIAGVILHARARPAPAPSSSPGFGLAALAGGVQGLMRSNKLVVLLGALAAGFAAGESERR